MNSKYCRRLASSGERMNLVTAKDFVIIIKCPPLKETKMFVNSLQQCAKISFEITFIFHLNGKETTTATTTKLWGFVLFFSFFK